MLQFTYSNYMHSYHNPMKNVFVPLAFRKSDPRQMLIFHANIHFFLYTFSHNSHSTAIFLCSSHWTRFSVQFSRRNSLCKNNSRGANSSISQFIFWNHRIQILLDLMTINLYLHSWLHFPAFSSKLPVDSAKKKSSRDLKFIKNDKKSVGMVIGE